MMKINTRTLISTMFVCMLSTCVYIIYIHHFTNTFWNSAPLTHTLIMLSTLSLFLNIGLSTKICRTNGAKFLVSFGKWIMSISILFLVSVSIISDIYPEKTIYETSLPIFLGIIFIISGNYFPKNHVNPFIGMKFPWLLNDEESWDKTHKLSSYTWIMAGLVLIVQMFIKPLSTITTPLILILMLGIPIVYSLILVYKNKNKEVNSK